MATTFDDLEFKDCFDGKQAAVFFENGYGASVVQHQYSYGGDNGLWELAVLKGQPGKSSLCYDTPITGDVEGHLTEAAVTKLLADIEALDTA